MGFEVWSWVNGVTICQSSAVYLWIGSVRVLVNVSALKHMHVMRKIDDNGGWGGGNIWDTTL